MSSRTIRIAQDEHADEVLSTDDFGLLVGMLLDQQFPMERAFAGPAKILDRFGTLDPAAIAAAAANADVITDGSADATANEALFQREIDSNLALATQLQLNATPTWIVGDQLFQGQIGYDALKQAVAKARART